MSVRGGVLDVAAVMLAAAVEVGVIASGWAAPRLPRLRQTTAATRTEILLDVDKRRFTFLTLLMAKLDASISSYPSHCRL